MSKIPQNPEVIVVGAGTAGLSAATALLAAGIETVVLEAAAHTGGRCVTDTTTFSAPFDRGGSWLHSVSLNPLARLAEQRGAVLHKAPWLWSHVHTEGYDLTSDEVLAYRGYQEAMWLAINNRGAETPDTTTAAAMPDGPFKTSATCSIPQMMAGDADLVSAADVYNYADAKGDWLVGGGLGAFIQDLHPGIPTQLNCPVSKIDYTGTGVEVTTPQGVLKAKHLILTVSTGVLASGAIEFVPALPIQKQDAVEMLPNGLLNKVGIEFDPAWCDATQGQIADYHTGDDAFCSLLFGFFETSIATGFLAGRFGEALEKEGVGAATDYCLQGLRTVFGNDVTKYVLRTDETNWSTNALTLGSYSYSKPGGAGARKVLAETLDERIFFAGEATMTETYATVHGAFLSGQQAAERVIATRVGASATLTRLKI
ncbi:amine oxidase [Phaeobacter gallaeciensis]|uniref:Tryptophan 2-monooxygenase n=1 Tax=Phaeobacter gallaeciensis TaxID=60890 RepID=A0A366WVK2_9RHOB|nr:NAD(P)/FAD-dependent oxidoreductase [Phaeobacter gallaeciensis]RBW53536.1 amine oxidase [Phaeobacter gallaeciensis]